MEGVVSGMREELIQAALEARKKAYTPYSHYQVGAALFMEDGEIFTGCNIENASYGATCCAERTAVFKAVSEGNRKIQSIAIVGGLEGEKPVDYAYPCGICRQVLNEFGGAQMKVIVAKSVTEYKEYTLGELLPCSFGGESIR